VTVYDEERSGNPSIFDEIVAKDVMRRGCYLKDVNSRDLEKKSRGVGKFVPNGR